MNLNRIVTKLRTVQIFLRKGRVSKREFCFWVIPAGEASHVKKVRISLWKLATAFAVTTCFLATLLMIAVDYVRVHGLNVKNYALWRNTASQRNSLLGEKDDLHAKIDSFLAANNARALLDSELDTKLEELSRFITESKAVTPESTQLAKYKIQKSPGAKDLEKAIGGLEKGCPNGLCDLFEQDLIATGNEISQSNSARAVYNPKSLFGVEKGSNQLEQLTESIRIIRALPLLVPVQGDLSSGYGFRWSPFEHGVAKHEGIDFSAPVGTAIGSAGDGIVKEVKRNSTYGLLIDIEHTPRISTRYAHLSSALVAEGEKVLRGDLIGQVGSSGRSTGPHLHYEVILDKQQVNPEKYIALSERLAQLMKK